MGEAERVEGGSLVERGRLPSEYSRSCISGWVFSSHSLHFFAVPPNSQY